MENKKKILMIMAHLNGAGAEKTCIDFLRNFDNQRFDIFLLLIYKEGVFLSDVPPYVNVISLYDRLPGKWHEKLFKRLPELRNRGIKRQLEKRLGSERFDVIISFCEGLPVVAHSMLLDKGKTNLSWVHCDLIKYPWTKRYFRSAEAEGGIYSLMDKIVLVSQEARDSFRKKYGINETLEVIPNIIDRNLILEKSDEFHVEKNRFTIINIGRMVPVKNHARLIEMTAILKERGHDLDLWILGDGPLYPKLRALAEEKGIAENVKFWGFQKNPYPYLKSSDIYVMSSDSEGYSLTISEALCLGLPIVSTPTARINELRDSGAVEIAEFSAESLADNVESFIENPKKISDYSEKSSEYGKLFDPRNVLEKIYSLMK